MINMEERIDDLLALRKAELYALCISAGIAESVLEGLTKAQLVEQLTIRAAEAEKEQAEIQARKDEEARQEAAEREELIRQRTGGTKKDEGFDYQAELARRQGKFVSPSSHDAYRAELVRRLRKNR